MRRTSGNHAVCFASLEQAISENPEAYEHLDLVAFGFPCQDVSIAGNRKGLAGERSGLFFEAMRVVKILKPKWLLVENVPGLLSSNKGRDMATVLFTLAQSGYGWSYRILDSRYFGVAQRRRRVFIVGRSGSQCPPQILFEPESDRRHYPKNKKMEQVGLCILARDGERQDPGAETIIASCVKSSDYRSLPIGQFGNENNLVAGTVSTNTRGSPRKTTDETLIASIDSDGKREVAGVSHRFHIPRGIVLGNAVSVPVAEWIGRRIMEFGK